MASKRKRKLAKKESFEMNQRIVARRDAFNDNLWRYGPPIALALILILVVYFGFFYTLGPANAEEWKLEEAETGDIYKSSDYYNDDQLTMVEFFQSQCGHCQNQAPVLREIYANYSSQINMFSIGGYKMGSNTDSKSNIASFKFQYHNSEWPHLYDSTGDLMRAYGFSSYPSMALVKNNEIVYEHSGGLTYDQLSAEIEKHL